MLEHEHIEHKHVAEPQTTSQKFVQRILMRILELSTIELVVGILHLMITAGAVFGFIGVSGGSH